VENEVLIVYILELFSLLRMFYPSGSLKNSMNERTLSHDSSITTMPILQKIISPHFSELLKTTSNYKTKIRVFLRIQGI